MNLAIFVDGQKVWPEDTTVENEWYELVYYGVNVPAEAQTAANKGIFMENIANKILDYLRD